MVGDYPPVTVRFAYPDRSDTVTFNIPNGSPAVAAASLREAVLRALPPTAASAVVRPGGKTIDKYFVESWLLRKNRATSITVGPSGGGRVRRARPTRAVVREESSAPRASKRRTGAGPVVQTEADTSQDVMPGASRAPSGPVASLVVHGVPVDAADVVAKAARAALAYYHPEE